MIEHIGLRRHDQRTALNPRSMLPTRCVGEIHQLVARLLSAPFRKCVIVERKSDAKAKSSDVTH